MFSYFVFSGNAGPKRNIVINAVAVPMIPNTPISNVAQPAAQPLLANEDPQKRGSDSGHSDSGHSNSSESVKSSDSNSSESSKISDPDSSNSVKSSDSGVSVNPTSPV
ncbi:class I histocompatibility antigen [Huso huso]|uniref:Class I histocompatibility antigen n=1 Tax=Huso huso TaxID=61971 RepID=A0ABR0Y0A0_HUSHU